MLQDLIPDVGQLDFAYIPNKGWIIVPDVHGFLASPGSTMCLGYPL